MAYNEEYDRINNIHNNFSYLNYSKLEEKIQIIYLLMNLD